MLIAYSVILLQFTPNRQSHTVTSKIWFQMLVQTKYFLNTKQNKSKKPQQTQKPHTNIFKLFIFLIHFLLSGTRVIYRYQ